MPKERKLPYESQVSHLSTTAKEELNIRISSAAPNVVSINWGTVGPVVDSAAAIYASFDNALASEWAVANGVQIVVDNVLILCPSIS
jgi:hypothetical protein